MSGEFKTNNFDLLRIFAATQVVFSHTVAHLRIPHPIWWPIVNAFPGVPIFFVISGFLISASYERSSGITSYFQNRLLRILPGLWCCVLVTMLVAASFGFGFLHWQAVGWFLSQLAGLIYTPGFLRSFGFGSYNGSLWTIPIELQFYILLPLFYWPTMPPRRRTLFIGAALICFSIVTLVAAHAFAPLAEVDVEPLPQKLLRYSFLPHIYLFIAGMLMQRLQIHRSRWVAGKGLYWLAAYAAFYWLIPYSSFSYVAATLLTGIAVVALAYSAPQSSERILKGNDTSYGVYIYHGLIINVFVELGLLGELRYLWLLLLLTFAAAFLSWRLVERPLLRKKRQSIHPASRAVAA